MWQCLSLSKVFSCTVCQSCANSFLLVARCPFGSQLCGVFILLVGGSLVRTYFEWLAWAWGTITAACFMGRDEVIASWEVPSSWPHSPAHFLCGGFLASAWFWLRVSLFYFSIWLQAVGKNGHFSTEMHTKEQLAKCEWRHSWGGIHFFYSVTGNLGNILDMWPVACTVTAPPCRIADVWRL